MPLKPEVKKSLVNDKKVWLKSENLEGELISIADLITTNTELVQFDITKCEFGASDLTPLVKAIFKSKNLTTSNLPAVFKDFQIGRVLAVKSKLLTIYKNAVASCLKLRQEINSDNNIYVIDVRTHIFQILASFEATIKKECPDVEFFDYVADLRREFSDVFGFLEPSIKSEPTISKTQSDPSKDYAFVHPISTSSVLHSLNNNNNSSTIEKTHSCLKVSGLNQSNKSDLKYKIYLQKAEVNKIEFLGANIAYNDIVDIIKSVFFKKEISELHFSSGNLFVDLEDLERPQIEGVSTVTFSGTDVSKEAFVSIFSAPGIKKISVDHAYVLMHHDVLEVIKAAHFSLFVDQKTEINLQSKTPRFLNLVGFLQEMVPYVHSATSNNNGQKFSNEIIQLLDDIFVDLGKGVPNELETQKLKTSLLYEVYSSLNDFSKKQALGKLMLAESQGTYDLCVRDLKSFSFTAESEQEKNTKLMQILRKMGYLIRLAEKVAMANGVISSSDLLKFQANCHREVSTYALDKQLPIPLKFRLNILDLLEKDFLRNIEKDVLDLVKNQIGECIVDSSDSKRSSLNKLKKHIAKAEDLSDVMSAIKDFQGEKADKYPNTNLQLETIQPHLEKLCVKIAVLSVPSFT